MNKEKAIFENKEAEPKHNLVTAYFLRHGRTEYLENKASEEQRTSMEGIFPRDLTVEGESEVRETAKKIIKKINPENDIVVLWSSPAWRAQGSEEIIKEELKKNGIAVYKDRAISSMKNFDYYDKEYMDDLWNKLTLAGESPELMYARDSDFQEKNDKFESQPEVKERAERVFNYIRYLAEHINLKGKRLCIVGVSHFEFLNPIMEDIFGPKVETNEGINKGEDIEFNFDYNPGTKNTSVSVEFRGESKDGIIFDKEKRNFIIN